MKRPMKSVPASAKHQAFRDRVLAVMKEPAFVELPPDEMLAVLSYTVGQLIALQDQRAMTPAQAMRLVADNIEAGNADAIRQNFGKTEGRA